MKSSMSHTLYSMKHETNYIHAYAGMALDYLLETGTLGKPCIQSTQNSCISL